MKPQGSDLHTLAVQTELKDSVNRGVLFSFLLAPISMIYGFTSYEFISRFNPNLRLWENVLPRLPFSALLFLCFGLLAKKLRVKDSYRLFLVTFGIAATLHVTAWIQVWPLALGGKPEILTYVNAANIYFYAFLYSLVSPPRSYLAVFSGIILSVFVIPFCCVAFLTGDLVIFKLVANDSLLTLVTGFGLAWVVADLRLKLRLKELGQAQRARQFLDPLASHAIYNEETWLTGVRKKVAFVVTMDIRG